MKELISAIVLIVVCFTAYVVINRFTGEAFCTSTNGEITFLSGYETAKVIKQDPDNYLHSLSPWDLYARKSKTMEEYIMRCVRAVTEFSDNERSICASAARKADALLVKHNYEIISAMKWNLALTNGRVYEDGMPHTRMDIVFLDRSQLLDSRSLVLTLVHEKLHLFQRANPEKMAQLLDSSGYTQWKLRAHEPRIRANPDLDPWIYIDPRTGKPMATYYTSDKPINLSDVDTNAEDEHPYERMAYELVEKIS
jgi:hypothetical protein